MREAKLYLVDLVSHCHEGTIAKAFTRPGISSCDCMWTCSRTAVAFSKGFIAKAFNCPSTSVAMLHYSHRSVCFWCTALKAVLQCSTRSALPQVEFPILVQCINFWKFRTFTADFSVGTLGSPARSTRQVPLLPLLRGDILAVSLHSHSRLRNVTLVCILCAYNGDLTMALV